MNVNAEKMEKQEMNLPYEQPILKKYGTMKEFTLNSSGSGGGRSKNEDVRILNDISKNGFNNLNRKEADPK